ncbi:MAG: FHA domain-containing protein [Chloroflexota bacterium]
MTKNSEVNEQTPKEDSPILSSQIVGEGRSDAVSHHFMGNAVSHEQGKLTIDFGDIQESLVVLVDDSVILGRGAQENPIEVSVDLKPYGASEKGVSRRHARLHRTTTIIYVTDLKSLNGTFLNNERLLPHQARILRDGDEVRLGNLAFHIHLH